MTDEKKEGVTNFSVGDLPALKDAFEVRPYSGIDNLENKPGFTKLPLDSDKKMQISALTGVLPDLVANGAMSQAYMLEFPNGISGVLMQYKSGGLGTPIMGENGIIGHASLHPISNQAVICYGAFNVMSIASGQYFLSEINSKLTKMKQSLDKILEFLYGDKRAELMSEVSFTKYAYENFGSIMSHDVQRTATIGSLQEAKKVAMKDIEFYMADLDSTVNQKDISDIAQLVDQAFRIKDGLELSMQLYVMSGLLEVYYAQNYDAGYIQYIEREMRTYIDKSEKHILADFSVLGKHIGDYKGNLLKKIDKAPYEKQVVELVEGLNTGEESDLRKSLHSALRASGEKAEYYIGQDGDVYLKTS